MGIIDKMLIDVKELMKKFTNLYKYVVLMLKILVKIIKIALFRVFR